MEKAEHQIKKLREPSKEKCFYPSYTFFLDYNGDVLMCSHDWGKKNILGKDLTHLLECYNIKTLDLLTCDMITLAKFDKTEIRYSLDRTGNPDNERTNWLLESHNVNIEKEYFSTS